MITLENADKALKEYYLQAVSAQLNDGISPFFAAIEKNTENVYGKNAQIAVIRNNAGSVMACAEDADLPDAHANRYLGITVPLKNVYGAIEVSDKALRASRDASGGFVNLVNAEMEGLISAAKSNFRRMLYGDGNGTLCKITSLEDKVATVDGVKEYFVGMTVDVLPQDGQATGNIGLTITAVDKAQNTVTLSAAPASGTFTGGTIAVSGAKGVEITGLGAIFNGQTLYGYSKEEEPYFKPYSKAVSQSLTEDDLVDMMDYLEENFNSKVNMILCSFGARKKIAALVADNRRVINGIDANTGFGVVTVNNVPVYADRYCPEGVIYFLNTEDFQLCQLCDWEWLEDEDGKILKQVPGKAAYGATLVKYAELICKKPCGQAVLTGV